MAKPNSDKFSEQMNFSWVLKGIAGCRGPHPHELKTLHGLGLDAVVRLAAESDVTTEEVEAAGMLDCYEPVDDWTPPSQSQIDRVVAFIHTQLEANRTVAVSCGAGYGRTGTILACYLVSEGRSAEEAIELLVSIRPVSAEILKVPGQREAVEEFHRRTHPAAN